MPVDAEPTLVLKSTTVSAVAVSITYDYTVAFIGTTDGRIIKVRYHSLPELLKLTFPVLAEILSGLLFRRDSLTLLFIIIMPLGSL